MGEMFDWQILSGDPTGSPVVSTTSFDYKLRNRTYRERLAYGERRYGINLVWTPSNSTRSTSGFSNVTAPGRRSRTATRWRSESTTAATSGTRVAITGSVLSGPSRRCSSGRFARQRTGSSGTPITTGDSVGLYNLVEDDFLFDDPRRYGINLKWLRDEGRFNDSPWWRTSATGSPGAGATSSTSSRSSSGGESECSTSSGASSGFCGRRRCGSRSRSFETSTARRLRGTRRFRRPTCDRAPTRPGRDRSLKEVFKEEAIST